MNTPRLTELPVKHLEYVFSPPGLPLPLKGDSEVGTTSLLVRGGAGTGKTTFALALAHAAAKAGGGLVLYLTTEFSPVEIVFKATLIDLPEAAVDIWPGTGEMTPGNVLVEHLSNVRHGNPVLSSAERRRSSIDAVWGLLHPPKEGAAMPTLPVRSVVIDALTLPEPGEKEGAQRSDLVAFVQALENEGISVVLVEELAQGASAWSSFVVDVVFELSFQPDPETQDLRRKVTLAKSRYALSLPGPHDYGLESGVPAVWPDLFRVVTIAHGATETPLFRVTPPLLRVPLPQEDKWAALGASIVLSPYDTAPGAPDVLIHTPGAAQLMIRCGARTSIGRAPHLSHINEDDGVHAIGWAALSSAKMTGANWCYFDNLERLLSRPDSTARVSRLLEALRLMGFMVCVNAPRDSMRSLDATADHIWDGTKVLSVNLLPRRHKSHASQCFTMPWMKELSADAEGNPSHRAAWHALHTGADWQAARSAFAAVESEKPEPLMLLLWKAICAAIAENLTAIDELKALIGSPDEILILAPLLQGLAETDQLDEADRILADVGARHTFAPWMLDRLRADTRLDATSPAVLRDAAARLETLTADESIPVVHRAETWHNLGTAQDRLGQRDAAMASFKRAAELNPLLDAAREELERLQAPPPAPS